VEIDVLGFVGECGDRDLETGIRRGFVGSHNFLVYSVSDQKRI